MILIIFFIILIPPLFRYFLILFKLTKHKWYATIMLGDNMNNLDNIFTKKTCITIFIISLALFAIFEFLIFNILFLFLFMFYGICIILYFVSTIKFINIKNKNIIECLLFLLSGLFLIIAGLTDIDYNFFGPEQKLIDSVPEATSDFCFVLCSILSIVLMIVSIIKTNKSKTN